MEDPIREDQDSMSVDVAEAEMWENSHDKIPRLLQPSFASAIGDFNLNTRIRIYKILAIFGWHFNSCELILKVFQHAVAHENISAILNVFELVDSTSLHNILCIFINIDFVKVREFLYEIPPHDILKLLDVVSFVDKMEFELVYDFIQKLSVRELIAILDKCNEPFAKQCRLCKAQRLASLEFRLLHDQITTGTTHGFLPGMEPTYDLSDVWKNDIDQDFKFVMDRGLVFWRKELVDTMRICDKCLGNVIRAAGNVGRFDPIYHIAADEMKTVYKNMREEERQRAELFQNLSLERTRRRVREWSIRALKERRIQLLKDDEEEATIQRQRENGAKLFQKEEGKRNLIHLAMAVDTKWQSQEVSAQDIRTKNLVDFAHLRNFPAYDENNPVSTTREHPLSWRLKMYASPSGSAREVANTCGPNARIDYDLLGSHSLRPHAQSVDPSCSKSARRQKSQSGGELPVHVLASSTRFGTASNSVDLHIADLRTWKCRASKLYYSIAEREQKEAEERRLQAEREKVCILDYIASRQASDEAEQRRRRNAIEQAEADRLDRRVEDRLRRRAARQEKEESKERGLMEIEDSRSVAYQFLIWERNMEMNELQRMQLAEQEQWAKGDRFWGIILFEIEQTRLAELRQALWQERVNGLREMCLNVKITKPFHDEKGVFRDFEYQLPINP